MRHGQCVRRSTRSDRVAARGLDLQRRGRCRGRESIARLLRGRYTAHGELKPRYYIKVRWPPAMDDDAPGLAADRAHHLEEGVWLEGETWRYLLGDPSIDAVAGAHAGSGSRGHAWRRSKNRRDHAHRRTAGTQFLRFPETTMSARCSSGRTLSTARRGGDHGCGLRRWLRVGTQSNAAADGFLFLSEPDYSDRHAYVDGRPGVSRAGQSGIYSHGRSCRRAPRRASLRTLALLSRFGDQWHDGRGLRGELRPIRRRRKDSVTILFHVTLMTMLRHFEGVLLELAARGHRVRVALPDRRPDLLPPPALVEPPGDLVRARPAHRGDEWAHPIHELRTLRDYLRYLDDRYNDAPKLRARALREDGGGRDPRAPVAPV